MSGYAFGVKLNTRNLCVDLIVYFSIGLQWFNTNKKNEIARLQIRKKEIDEALAKRTLPRVPVDPSGMFTSITTSTPKLHGFTAIDDDSESLLLLSDHSSDESRAEPPSSGPHS